MIGTFHGNSYGIPWKVGSQGCIVRIAWESTIHSGVRREARSFPWKSYDFAVPMGPRGKLKYPIGFQRDPIVNATHLIWEIPREDQCVLVLFIVRLCIRVKPRGYSVSGLLSSTVGYPFQPTKCILCDVDPVSALISGAHPTPRATGFYKKSYFLNCFYNHSFCLH